MNTKTLTTLLILSSICLGCGGGKKSSIPGPEGAASSSSTSSSAPYITTLLEVVDGDNQSRAVGTVQTITLVVLSQASLLPVANTEVTVRVLGQSSYDGTQSVGSVADEKLISDSEGKVTIHWTLGTDLGTNHILAATPDIAGLQLTATSVAGPVATFKKVYDEDLIALTGNPVISGYALIQALDQYNNPVSGLTINCEVTEGGGRAPLTKPWASLTTNNQGQASCGTWFLGDTAGKNTLKISAGSVTMELHATAENFIVSLPETMVEDPAHISPFISSAHEIVSATAEVGATHAPLVPRYPGDQRWIGDIPLTGYPRGAVDIKISLQDIEGNSKTVIYPVLLDRPPIMTILSPTTDLVSNLNDVLLSATCTDDDSSTVPTIEARYYIPRDIGRHQSFYETYALGLSPISTHAALNVENDGSAFVLFSCRDSNNRTVLIQRELHQSSP